MIWFATEFFQFVIRFVFQTCDQICKYIIQILRDLTIGYVKILPYFTIFVRNYFKICDNTQVLWGPIQQGGMKVKMFVGCHLIGFKGQFSHQSIDFIPPLSVSPSAMTRKTRSVWVHFYIIQHTHLVKVYVLFTNVCFLLVAAGNLETDSAVRFLVQVELVGRPERLFENRPCQSDKCLTSNN